MQERKKIKKSNNYFDKKTEDAIIRLQQELDLEKKKEIFVQEIKPSFSKLIENIIFVYKFHTLGEIDILKNDCLSFLFENIYKFNGLKGHKAFSYFNVVAKHWFIQRIKINKKRLKSNVCFDSTLLNNLENSDNESIVFSYEKDILKNEFFSLLKDEAKNWRKKFEKEQEKKVLEAVILLLENPDLISIYNKKCIYLYLKEITGLNTKQIVTNLIKIRKKYNFFKKRYEAGEI
jgi:hypothetical protein